MPIKRLASRLARRREPPLPLTGAADARWSVVSSAHDHSGPDQDLLAVALDAARAAQGMTLDDLVGRCAEPDATWVRTWPGEHYRLLAALSAVVRPSVVVEVGTFKGQGALALAEGAPAATVITYDLVPWRDFSDTALRDDDLGRIEQRLGDLGDAEYRSGELETLRAADLIFIDGPKDGEWEQHAIPDLLHDLADRRRLVVLDDVRLLAMVQVWRDLPHLKMDITSLGHWSGTGILWTA